MTELNPVGVVLVVRLDDAQLDDLARRTASHVTALTSTDTVDRWLDTAAAAEYLGLHPDTLRKLAGSDVIESEQDGPGCKRFFRRSELERWRGSGGKGGHKGDRGRA